MIRTVKDWGGPVIIWTTFSVVQSWICVRYTWEQRTDVAVITVLVVFTAPVVNRWRVLAAADKRSMMAAVAMAGVFMGEGCVIYFELQSWVAGRDLASRALESQKHAAEEKRRDAEEKRRASDLRLSREQALAKVDERAALSASGRHSTVVQAEIERELSKVVSTKRDTSTIGKLTNGCKDDNSDHAWRCKRVKELAVELTSAQAAEKAAENLRAAPVAVSETKVEAKTEEQTADPNALARYLAGVFGGSVDDWANAPLLAASIFILIVRELSLVRVPLRQSLSEPRQSVSEGQDREDKKEDMEDKTVFSIMENSDSEDSAVLVEPIEKTEPKTAVVSTEDSNCLSEDSGQDSVEDRVSSLVSSGMSIRLVAKELGIGKGVVEGIVRRQKAAKKTVVLFARPNKT